MTKSHVEWGGWELAPPPWQDDESSEVCIKCKAEFGLFNRRHHCRRCGVLVCGDCSRFQLPLPRLNYNDDQRVCSTCLPFAQKELLCSQKLPLVLEPTMFTEVRSVFEKNRTITARVSSDVRTFVWSTAKLNQNVPKDTKSRSLQSIVSVESSGNDVNVYEFTINFRDRTLKLVASSLAIQTSWIDALRLLMEIIENDIEAVFKQKNKPKITPVSDKTRDKYSVPKTPKTSSDAIRQKYGVTRH